jgi:hypothetical protein
MEAHQSSRWMSICRSSGSLGLEHLLDLRLEISLEISAEGGLAPQKATAARHGLGGDRYQTRLTPARYPSRPSRSNTSTAPCGFCPGRCWRASTGRCARQVSPRPGPTEMVHQES